MHGSTRRTCFGNKFNIFILAGANTCGRVEQPVGTGYTVGTPKATSEEDIANDFVGFYKNFAQTFGLNNFKVYVTGESYAGRYVPYISSAMLDQKDPEYFDLKGKTQPNSFLLPIT